MLMSTNSCIHAPHSINIFATSYNILLFGFEELHESQNIQSPQGLNELLGKRCRAEPYALLHHRKSEVLKSEPKPIARAAVRLRDVKCNDHVLPRAGCSLQKPEARQGARGKKSPPLPGPSQNARRLHQAP